MLHIPRQPSCRGMYKIMTWLDDNKQNESKQNATRFLSWAHRPFVKRHLVNFHGCPNLCGICIKEDDSMGYKDDTHVHRTDTDRQYAHSWYRYPCSQVHWYSSSQPRDVDSGFYWNKAPCRSFLPPSSHGHPDSGYISLAGVCHRPLVSQRYVCRHSWCLRSLRNKRLRSVLKTDFITLLVEYESISKSQLMHLCKVESKFRDRPIYGLIHIEFKISCQ